MHIVEIVASIADRTAGPSYSVPRLAAAVARAGAQVELFTLGAPGVATRDGVTVRTFAANLARVPVLSQLRISEPMRLALRDTAMRADVLHSHGLWLMPNIYPEKAAHARGKSFVLSPRGMLGAPALRFSAIRKNLFWAALQRAVVLRADLMHATSEVEVDEIRQAGFAGAVAMIPNGIDLPDAGAPRVQPAKVVLSLGRIHPKKGLDRLVRAWSRLGAAASDWRLRIVGPSEAGHAQELQALVAQLQLRNVEIRGPVFGPEKLAEYLQADIFVLPTLNENFAMTVAEALAAATPVIATRGAPWSGLNDHKCGWWIEHGVDPLAAALKTAMEMPHGELRDMGARGRDWMQHEFSWDRFGREMFEVYRWLGSRGAPPSMVRL